ncbi:MAG TPA: TRAP transporter substrate-binding protein [Stellaceae bacterium]|jgi:TRAP-type C4-dicarboxylate transport system substrate-binding protein|nr:TRAP transporter substrate-binding protein [Stellaceae bacterium]
MARGYIGLGVALGLAASAAALAPAALAQDKAVQLKLSHWVPPAHPLQPALQAWAADIEKASTGTIKSTVFPSEQLGKAFDHYDMARDGIADFAYVNPGYQPGRFPIIAAGELPFLIADAKGGSAAFDRWYRKYAAIEMKDVHFCLAFVHDPGTFHSHKKILLPSDLKGLKVRPANATIGQFMTLLGATNVQASAPEARDVLSRGVADAITFPWGSIVLFGIDKVVNFHMDAALYVTTFVWVMNQEKYNGLSAAQKKVIDDHCTTEWAVKIAAPWADFEADGKPKIKAEAGHEVYPLTPAQLEEWRKAAEPLQAKWAENARKVGADPDKVLAELKDALKKQNALY